MYDCDLFDPKDQTSGQRVISGFWRRLLALFLDLVVLGVAFQVLESGASGKILVDGRAFVVGPFWSLGGWSHLVATCVALVYFGVLNSSIAWGQTIGKRVMQIQVIDRSGHAISPRSILPSICSSGRSLFVEWPRYPSDALPDVLDLLLHRFHPVRVRRRYRLPLHLQLAYASEPPRPDRGHVRHRNNSSEYLLTLHDLLAAVFVSQKAILQVKLSAQSGVLI